MKSPLTPKAQAALEQIEAGQGTTDITRQMIDRLFGDRLIDWDLDERRWAITLSGRAELSHANIVARLKAEKAAAR
jgi:hypothetical protein